MATANNPLPNDTFTIDRLNEAFKAMLAIAPKTEMFLSTKHCPGSDALRIEASGENFVIAHPLFWARFARECRPLGPITTNDLLGIARPVGGIDIVEMDGPFHDSISGQIVTRPTCPNLL
jgi:hypothetical protein